MPHLRLLCSQIIFSFFKKLFEKLRQELKWDTVTNQQKQIVKGLCICICVHECVCRREWVGIFTNKPTFRVKSIFIRSQNSWLFFFFFSLTCPFGNSDVSRELWDIASYVLHLDFLFLYIFIFYWIIVDLQCCVSGVQQGVHISTFSDSFPM